MRYLYSHYYKKLDRGFTDAEFQQVCEDIAGQLLTDVFEYVHTTKELDYYACLKYAGLELTKEVDSKSGGKLYTIQKIDQLNAMQMDILKSLLRKQKG